MTFAFSPGLPITVFEPGKGKDIKNADGTTGRPSHIGLAHELIHALRIMNGITIPFDDMGSFYDIVDPDTGEKGTLYTEEIKVREEENKVRKEQEVTERATPEEDIEYDFEIDE